MKSKKKISSKQLKSYILINKMIAMMIFLNRNQPKRKKMKKIIIMMMVSSIENKEIVLMKCLLLAMKKEMKNPSQFRSLSLLKNQWKNQKKLWKRNLQTKKKYQPKKSPLKKNLRQPQAKRKKAVKHKLDLVLQTDRKLIFKDSLRLKQEEKELPKRKKKLRKLKMLN